jgi:hypothetical protein
VTGCLLGLVLRLGQFGQSNTGELRLTVVDVLGSPLQGGVELVSEANQFRESLQTDPQGILIAKRLPFGAYRVAVTRDGFAPFVGLVEIRSALPTAYRATLSPAPVQAQVTVTAGETLLDPHQVMTVHRVGRGTLEQRMTGLPGRSLTDVVNAQPGWLEEANGILHPRGSEYQTQYIVDGLPLTDNRSPAFAPEIGAEDVQGINVFTAGYPAEYGRKLGGVIEVVTSGQARQGFHGSIAAAAGSFATRSGDVTGAYGGERTTISAAAGLAATRRYLDPPVEENFTNHGTTSHAAVRVERDLTDADRFGVIVRRGDAAFVVPNEYVQQLAGQRQDRDSAETAAQFSYQHVFSARAVAEVRGIARDLSAGLRSNPASIPILAEQTRGFREVYVKGAVSGHAGAHEWKAGADLVAAAIRERFGYQITDISAFDSGTLSAFTFNAQRPDREQAVFLQDQWRRGAWTVNAGVRWDHYRLVVEDSAISPRVGVAWSWPSAGLVLRGSYDRAFQTPAVENLLLAGDPAVETLTSTVLRLPVRASRGNFYDAGLSKTLFSRARIDVSFFRRAMSHFADDDLLLNTGIGFPITFHAAHITGTEIRLDVPRWRTVSGFVSYGHMRGTGELPVTGGLFLEEDAGALLSATKRFPVTQDQRHTIRGRVSDQLTPALWVAMAASFGSGLPVEFAGDRAHAVAEYGERIVDRVDLASGRVRPSFSLDASAGAILTKAGTRKVTLQIDVRNLTDRLNVINFAGVFSGTAIAPPRSVAVRLQAAF